MTTKSWPCMICDRRYAELEEAEVCERLHDALAPHGTLRALKARICAFCDHDPCTCRDGRPAPPAILAPEALLRLGALTLAQEQSQAVADHLADQQAVYAAASREQLLQALEDRDRLLLHQGRTMADQRAAGRLLREFMRGALMVNQGQAQIEAAEGVIRRLGGEPSDLRQLKLHGSTLGPLESPERVAGELASGERKQR